jgi:hypothetical protein
LFHAAAARGVLPSERCSSLGVAAPSRVRSAPLQSSTAVPEVRCVRSHPPGFTDSRARARWPGSPPELGRRFHRGRSHDFPDALDPTQRAHPVPTASSASKPSSPCESVPTRPRFRDASRPVLSWALPLQSLAPLEPRVLCVPVDRSVHRGLAPRRRGERSPRRQVRPHDLAAATTSLAPDPQCDCGSARAASRRQPCLPRPWDARP